MLIAVDFERAYDAVMIKTIPKHSAIATNPAIMGGKACIAGTRVTVETILRRFAEGYTMAEMLADYPPLTEANIAAALEYAADIVARPHEMVG